MHGHMNIKFMYTSYDMTSLLVSGKIYIIAYIIKISMCKWRTENLN